MADKLTPEEKKKTLTIPEEDIRGIVAAYGSEVLAAVQAGELDRLSILTDQATTDIKAQLAKDKEAVCHKCHGSGLMNSWDEYVSRLMAGEVTCPPCQGIGKYSESDRGSDGFEKCPRCKGEGSVERDEPEGTFGSFVRCPDCHGTGKAGTDREKIAEWFAGHEFGDDFASLPKEHQEICEEYADQIIALDEGK